MRNAETVLNVIRERGERGLPLEGIYRQLYNRELYLRAYGRLYSNQGATTRGTTGDTVDGMSLAKIDRLIDDLRHEQFRWTPVRRVNIPKPNGKTRPLGIPTWTDKLLQEVIRMILEAYYEPLFSKRSHGFRPNRGCHTALGEVVKTWTGTRWFIEGDIKGCFDNIDHEVLLSVLGEKLLDNRFLRLLEQMLRAGYMENWKYGRTHSGTPQGGVASPILANIYLDRLDTFVETMLTPDYTRGKRRKTNPAWKALQKRQNQQRIMGNHRAANELRRQMRQEPSLDPQDPSYRRLKYVRYADDFVLGLTGPKAEAEQIKETLEKFMSDTLRLELTREKTKITHASSQGAKFLGYELVNQRRNDKLDRNGRRAINGIIGLRVPAKVIEQYCQAYKANDKPTDRREMLQDDDYTIVSRYQAELRGIVQYYALAQNVSQLSRLKWVMQQSLAKTLANKHKTPRRKLMRRYKGTVETERGQRACIEVRVQRGEGKRPLVARFGGIPLMRKRQATLVDGKPQRKRFERNELVRRLLANVCELCGSEVAIQVHHIRALRDLKNSGKQEKPLWIQVMAARRRKTLVVCQKCHAKMHAGHGFPQTTA